MSRLLKKLWPTFACPSYRPVGSFTCQAMHTQGTTFFYSPPEIWPHRPLLNKGQFHRCDHIESGVVPLSLLQVFEENLIIVIEALKTYNLTWHNEFDIGSQYNFYHFTTKRINVWHNPKHATVDQQDSIWKLFEWVRFTRPTKINGSELKFNGSKL